MTKHIILWQLKDEFSAEEKQKIMADAKANLESLMGKIDGLLKIKVITEKLDTSNVDMMLLSKFENPEALKNYSTHPEHVAVADKYVRPFTKTRACIDYEV